MKPSLPYITFLISKYLKIKDSWTTMTMYKPHVKVIVLIYIYV